MASSRSRALDEPHIGKYRLIKTIGKGNFAKVKLAKHVPTGREVIFRYVFAATLQMMLVHRLELLLPWSRNVLCWFTFQTKHHVIVITASLLLLVIPCYHLGTYGCQAFSMAGQSVRKSLPATSETTFGSGIFRRISKNLLIKMYKCMQCFKRFHGNVLLQMYFFTLL